MKKPATVTALSKGAGTGSHPLTSEPYLVETRACAKINLFLDIVGRREDGYHLLSTVMQRISLADRLRLALRAHRATAVSIAVIRDEAPRAADGTMNGTPTEPCWQKTTDDLFEHALPVATDVGLTIYAPASMVATCASLGITVSNDLAVKAATAFFTLQGPREILAQAGGLDLYLELSKQIPSQAGLGGGSADAAAVLQALCAAFALSLDHPGLAELAVALGADVPFCLYGQTALCEGIGEILTPLSPFVGVPALVIKPRQAVSTPAAFAFWDHLSEQEREASDRPEREACLTAIQQKDLSALQAHAANVFELAVSPEYPELPDILETCRRSGASFYHMTGSGSAVVALYEDVSVRDRAAADTAVWQAVCGEGVELYSCQTI